MFLEYARERYKLGIGRKSDVLKAEGDLSEAEFERDTYLNSLAEAQNELGMITGISPRQFSNLENTWRRDQLDVYNEQIDELLSKAFRSYPELQAVNNLQMSQQARILQAKAGLFPRLGFNAGYNWSYNPAIQQVKGWYGVLTVQWPIFKGGEQRRQIQMEKTRKTVYENQADEIKIFLQKEISNRLIKIKEAESQIRLTERLIKTTSENLDVATAQYKVGTGSLLELTDARINDLRARQKKIQAITAYQIALASLERLTGNMNEIKKER
jgi:multidrug efflux system outer membrane protein